MVSADMIRKTRPSASRPWSHSSGKYRESGSSRLMVDNVAISFVRLCS